MVTPECTDLGFLDVLIPLLIRNVILLNINNNNIFSDLVIGM